MHTIINSKLVSRNAKIGQYAMLGTFIVLGIGLFLTITQPNLLTYPMITLVIIVGFFLSQVGTYYTNRWGRKPRPDEIIDRSLKGLDREYTLYHYVTPVHHLLVGPAGVWVIMPFYQNGTVSYTKNRWRIRGGGFAQTYLRFFGQEGLGRPDLESEADAENLKRYFKRRLLEDNQIPEVRSALLFAHPQVDLQVDEAPLPALRPKELKEFMRKKGKEEPLPKLQLEALRQVLPQPQKEE